MPLPHGKHIRVNPIYPEAAGRCDRCGFIYNRVDLQWQYQWAGQELVNLQLLVCDPCLDDPDDQRRSIILPPDPLPIWQPRAETFAVDEAGPGISWESGLAMSWENGQLMELE